MGLDMILGFLQFPAELVIAEAAFLIDRERKERFPIRVSVALAVYFILSAGWSMLIEMTAGDTIFPYVFLYLGYAVLSLLPVWFCFELEPLECVFVIAGGYATEHMVFALNRIILFTVYGTLVTEGLFLFLYCLLYWSRNCLFFDREEKPGERCIPQRRCEDCHVGNASWYCGNCPQCVLFLSGNRRKYI